MLGEICVRLSRDGAATGTKFTTIRTLSPSVKLIMPAVLHMAEASGRLADTLKSGGRSVQLRVDRDPASQAPLFTASATPEETLGTGNDIERIVADLRLDPAFVSWQQFCAGDGWGLPPTGMTHASRSMQLPSSQTAIDVCELLDSTFELELSSSLSLGEFCIGLAGITATEADANELAHALAQGAPPFLRTSCDSLLSQINRILSRSITGSESAVKAMYIAISKLPPSGMAPASQSMQLPVCDPALGVCELLDSAFGLVLSSSLSLGEFCIGLAGITATEADANELAHALSQGAPTFLRTSGESLLSQIERVLSRSITGSESAVKAMYIAISKMPLWLLLSPFYFAGAAARSLVLEQAGLNGDASHPWC
jgi:hypothetical protein